MSDYKFKYNKFFEGTISEDTIEDVEEYDEEDVEDNVDNEEEAEQEDEANRTQELIKYLVETDATNADLRADFAKTIFELSLSSDPEARKFIKKVSQFISYWGDDNNISEEEWRKLNNTEEV